MSAERYPSEMIAQVVGGLIKKYYNQKTKIICIHESEKIAMGFARNLFNKGYDHIHMLRGGVHEFVEDYPELAAGSEVPARLSEISSLSLTKAS